MKEQKDTIDHLFENLKGSFDDRSPKDGHREAFIAKLNAQKETPLTVVGRKRNWWIKPLAIAASVVFIVTITLAQNSSQNEKQLADVSPEMAQTQDFFTTAINDELANIKLAATPETQGMIDDALLKLEKLELDYEEMKRALVQSGNDKRVIHAMIDNFQSRINLLNDVLENIETIKDLNTITTPAVL